MAMVSIILLCNHNALSKQFIHKICYHNILNTGVNILNTGVEEEIDVTAVEEEIDVTAVGILNITVLGITDGVVIVVGIIDFTVVDTMVITILSK